MVRGAVKTSGSNLWGELFSKWSVFELLSLSSNAGNGGGEQWAGGREENCAKALRPERSVLLPSSLGAASPALAGFLLNLAALTAFRALPGPCELFCLSALCCRTVLSVCPVLGQGRLLILVQSSLQRF